MKKFFMAYPILKSQITSTKLQINLNLNYPMTKTFGILNFGSATAEFVCYLIFVICDFISYGILILKRVDKFLARFISLLEVFRML
jgi:hypothetical protein